MVLQVGMAHLEFSQCEASSETHTMSVNKREQVAVSLDLLSLLREAILVKPALRSELVRVGTPECNRGVHAANGNDHFLTCGNGNAVDQLASRNSKGGGERNDIVLVGLSSEGSQHR